MNLRIKEILKAKSISQKELAEMVGVTPIGMSKALNGYPNTSTLEKIAFALNVEMWELFTESTSKEELTALISYKGEFFKANTVEELEEVVDKIKSL